MSSAKEANVAALLDLYARVRIMPRVSSRLPLEHGTATIRQQLADRKLPGMAVVTMGRRSADLDHGGLTNRQLPPL